LINHLVFSNPGHLKRQENSACALFLASSCFALQGKKMMMPASRINQFFD